jgi:hypothetical protein
MNISVFRILGNDLPPRHVRGQTYQNTRFILDHEPELAFGTKQWIVNRIVDPEAEADLLELLRKHGQQYLHVPFDCQEYRASIKAHLRKPTLRALRDALLGNMHLKILYIMNVNGARNIALEHGKQKADWVFPLDGNCCFTRDGWDEIVEKLSKETDFNQYFLLPMHRLTSNDQYFSFKPADFPEHEPQVIIGRDTQERFHPRYRYGADSKIEFINRIGFHLSRTKFAVTADNRERHIGSVVRLYSGQKTGESDLETRRHLRHRAIRAMLRNVDALAAQSAWGRMLSSVWWS